MRIPASVRRQLISWWNNENTGKPVILAQIPALLPPIEDVSAFWASNDIRYDRAMTAIRGAKRFGCALPIHYVSFGSSALLGSYGCPMNPLSEDTIWPSRLFDELPAPEDFDIRWDSPWHKMMLEQVARSAKDPENVATAYALGGLCDTLGNLCGEETLLYALMDEPEKVHRCLDKLADGWIRAAKEQWDIILRHQDGCASWAGIWAPGSTFPLQEDFSFMLSDEMYREFCLPYLKKIASAVEYPLYHLDGPPAICHLDSLLEIPNLRAVQWVPGAGQEIMAKWHGLVKRILASGKSAQVYCTPEELTPLIDEVGPDRLLVTINGLTEENLHLVEPYL